MTETDFGLSLACHRFAERWTGKTHHIDVYRFINQIPIRDGKDAQDINWCEIITTLRDGTIVYRNSFVTNFIMLKTNVKQIVADGCARWKIENWQPGYGAAIISSFTIT